MRNFLIGLAVVILLIVLTSLVGVILWPLGVVGYLYLKSKNAIWVYGSAFVLGLLVDLVLGLPFGFSSLILLGFALALFVTGIRFRSSVKVTLILIALFEILYFICYNFIPF